MKKVLLGCIASLFVAFGAQAQSGTGIGVKAGLNLPSYSYGSSNDLSDSKSTTNFFVTAFLDAPVASNLYVQPGVSLQGKGATLLSTESLGGVEVTQNTMWLEVPVNLVGKFDLGMGKVAVGAGPYFGVGLSGKNKISGESSGNSIEKDFKFGSDEMLKRTDFGVNFLVAYELYNGFTINGGYGLGLTNLAGDKALTNDLKNRVWSIGVGFGI
ncbi:MAG TPA: PorT family protein [Candidatus Sphingobacterium stercoripullorum]|uniref:PorT family protein n=1 Tax=Candidatus Sphingobacterium stercoripullorum TaxID=2838759 RepID=A0A9D1WBK5_9SPHI|nr:PorT family protein [Candidatus Sphingobacterium stercoripullorum]